MPWGRARVCVSLQGEGTWCRYLELPRLSGRELDVAVPALAHKDIPVPLEEVVLHHVVVPALSGGDKTMAIFLVGARHTLVASVRKLLDSCGLDVQRLDITPLALTRELYRNHTLPPQQVSALVHIGFRDSQVVVVRDGCPYYVRHFWPAARDFVEGIRKEYGTSWAEAQDFLRGAQANADLPVLDPMVSRWIGEAQRTVRHGNALFLDRKLEGVSQVYLSGGVSGLPGLHMRLERALGVSTVLDSWERLNPGPGQVETVPAQIYKTAIGLALND